MFCSGLDFNFRQRGCDPAKAIFAGIAYACRQAGFCTVDRAFAADHISPVCGAFYAGEHTIKNFTCPEQFLRLAFAQLTYRESLRDIEACLRAQRDKPYHMGIRRSCRSRTLRCFLPRLSRGRCLRSTRAPHTAYARRSRAR